MTDKQKETVTYKIKDIPLPLKCYPYGIIHSLTIYEDHIEIVKSDPNTEVSSILSQYKQQLVEELEQLHLANSVGDTSHTWNDALNKVKSIITKGEL